MTYPPTPGPDGSQPPPPDPPYQPPQAYPLPQAYQPPPAQDPYSPQLPYGQGAVDPYGFATPQRPQYDYGNAGSPYSYSPYAVPRPTEGMAIASLAVSCVAIAGLCGWGIGGLLGILGAIFGHVARRKIRQSGANGSGMALAGIIIGWIVTGIAVIGVVFVIGLIATDSSSSEF